MRQPRGFSEHQCAPLEWRTTPNVTGDYDLDRCLMANPNHDMPKRLAMYLTDGNAYGYRTAYSGYKGYHGDE